MELRHDIQATHGTWFVLRARGRNAGALALSAPIYVVVDGEGFWKRSEVPSIVAKLKQKMQELLSSNQVETCCEPWEPRETDARYWNVQRSVLKERVAQANALYDELLKRSAASP